MAFGPRGEQVAEAPDHVGVSEMGASGGEGNAAESAALVQAKVAIEGEGRLNFTAPIRMAIGPGGKHKGEVARDQRRP